MGEKSISFVTIWIDHLEQISGLVKLTSTTRLIICSDRLGQTQKAVIPEHLRQKKQKILDDQPFLA